MKIRFVLGNFFLASLFALSLVAAAKSPTNSSRHPASAGGSDGGGTSRPHSDRSLLEIKAITRSAKIFEVLGLSREILSLKLVGRNGNIARYELVSQYIDGSKPCTLQVEINSAYSLPDSGVEVLKVTGVESCLPWTPIGETNLGASQGEMK